MFYDKDYLQNAEKHLPFNEHLQKLNAFKEKLISKSNPQNTINKIRQIVYKNCSDIQTLNKNGGLFSLTAPTSSGKTLAMVNFALQQATQYDKKRIFFVLPYLSITSQSASIYKGIFGEEFVLEDDSQSELHSSKEQELVNRWSTDFIITTSIKFFEAFFKNNASDLRKLHNITNSVIVIDEYQSIPPHLLQTTTNTLRELANRYGCIILFASATPPNYSFRKGIEWWSTEVKEVINDVNSLFEMYSKTKKLHVHWCLEKKETHTSIAKKISKMNNVVVICNTKKSAKKTYKKLLQYKKQDECFLLSSDLCNKHKLEVIEEITQRQKMGLPLFVVSTQCIEAGVDISFDFMYRELAPLHSIVQAAGRCDRHCQGNGHFYVFCFEEESNPDISYKNAKKQTQILLSDFKNGIDISDLSALAEYYKKLYTLNYFSKDKVELLDAIENFDFDETCKQFRVIEDKDQYHIVVPHETEMKFFNSVLRDFDIDGTTDIKNLRKLQKITVNSYDENLKGACKPLLFSTKRNPEGIDFGFYILLPNTHGIQYDKKLGLNIEDTQLIF
jgi:CRISPR-associated endonuclease/helicase Cas3